LSSCKYILLAICLALPQLTSAQLRINEFLALNAAAVADPDFGRFADFIELHNSSLTAMNLKDYSITDNPANPGKWRFPDALIQPGGYLLLWADGRDVRIGESAFCEYRNAFITVREFHVNFSLSGDGEYIGLFNAVGGVVDEIHFTVQSYDFSYGRDPGNAERWLFFSPPTPGERNSDFGAEKLHLAPPPVFSPEAGFYATEQLLRIGPPTPSSIVRFTFDGSTPDERSPVFPDSFLIHRNYVVKARVFENGKLPGPVVTAAYFIGENIDLPVLSLSTDDAHLYDIDFGILRNAIKEREVPVVIEYFRAGGTREFTTTAGARVFGSTIYALPQRPLSIRFRSRYGASELQYPLFESRQHERYHSFLLRNGGNDYNMAYFRDGLATLLVRDRMDIDCQDYQPCIVFINGMYHGIYEIRERLDNSYIANTHDISDANLDMLEDSLIVTRGSSGDYIDILRFLQEDDVTTPQAYEHIARKIDVHEYINYMIHKIFIGYRIFQYNNKYWRDSDGGSPWRWIANDMEHAFGELGGDDYHENTLRSVAGADSSLPGWTTFLFSTLLTNPQFRDDFIQRFAHYINTIYRPAETLAIVDSLHAMLAPHMPRHIDTWGSPPTVPVWEGNIDLVRDFLRYRPIYMREHLASYFSIPDSILLTIHIEGQGQVTLAGAPLTDIMYSGHYFGNTMLALSAHAAPGYRFREWRGIAAQEAHTRFTLTDTVTVVAVFEKTAGSIIPAVIDRDTTLTAVLGPWYAVEDVVVREGVVLNVQPGVDILMTDRVSLYVYGGLSIAGTAEARVTITSDASHTARRPLYNRQPAWGVIAAIDATHPVYISHADISGSRYGHDRGKHFASITSLNSHIHITHTRIDDNIQPFYSEGGSVYIGYSAFRSQNTCDLINVKYCDQAVVEYCDLHGNRAPDTDAIDYDGVIGGVIRHNHIYGFHADNSDGIDLGEGALDILIEYNYIHDCYDKGISIGQGSTAVIRHNVIFDCDMGVALKDHGSHALIDRNTLYMNNYAVACYEKNTSRGGATAEVRNSILSQSRNSTLLRDEQSTISVSWSLSDTEQLPGPGNLFADPLFVNPAAGNFELQPSSPCIDAGDPASPADPDGSRADIGAAYRHSSASGTLVQINEVNFFPHPDHDTGDWIELYNNSDSAVDISGWRISHGPLTFSIPQGSILRAREYLVICEDSLRFRQFHPGTPAVMGNLGFSFSNTGGRISLLDAQQRLLHSLRYTDDWPSSPLAAGLGATLELEHGKDGSEAADWRESYLLMGTPGAENSRPPALGRLYINELMASNGTTIADEYGEFDDWFEIYNDNDYAVNIGGLYFTDDFSRPTRWQVPLHAPSMTTIAPKGFLLLWADGQPEQGPLHADFRLSIDGEALGMFQRRDEGFFMIDGIVFGEQIRDISYGRYPNGGQQWNQMAPTPGASNVPSGIAPPRPVTAAVYPNPFHEYINIDATGMAKPWRFTLYSILGTVVAVRENIITDSITLRRDGLHGGMYFYRMRDARGEQIVGSILAR
jgi:hypothetical protein